jgi:hypothetical protein
LRRPFQRHNFVNGTCNFTAIREPMPLRCAKQSSTPSATDWKSTVLKPNSCLKVPTHWTVFWLPSARSLLLREKSQTTAPPTPKVSLPSPNEGKPSGLNLTADILSADCHPT